VPLSKGFLDWRAYSNAHPDKAWKAMEESLKKARSIFK
jgi:hypothetical protein